MCRLSPSAVCGCIAALYLASMALAQVRGPPAEFIGTTPEWSVAGIWSTGQVPGAGTDVLINGADVVIDPAMVGGPVVVNDVWVGGNGSLTLLPGTAFTCNFLTIDGGGVDARSSQMQGDELQIVTARDSLVGQFVNLPEGAIAASFGAVYLLVSYDATGVMRTAAPSSSSSVQDWWHLD